MPYTPAVLHLPVSYCREYTALPTLTITLPAAVTTGGMPGLYTAPPPPASSDEPPPGRTAAAGGGGAAAAPGTAAA